MGNSVKKKIRMWCWNGLFDFVLLKFVKLRSGNVILVGIMKVILEDVFFIVWKVVFSLFLLFWFEI